MKKVMLVEDEEFILQGIRCIIDWEEISMTVVSMAHNGREALEMFSREPADIVVTDVEMPLMNGLELLEEIRKINPRTRCIILSGYDEFEYARTALKLDVEEAIRVRGEGRPVKVVANLPYYITTPIIMSLLEGGAPLESITVMVQKEVAERMQAVPGTKDYGALSLAVQYYSRPEVVANVPPNCFIPRPNVGSAVIRLTRYGTPPVQAADPGKLFTVIRASFNQRRKTLANSLGNAPGLLASRERVAGILEEMGLPAMIRGEALTLEQFAELSDRL